MKVWIVQDQENGQVYEVCTTEQLALKCRAFMSPQCVVYRMETDSRFPVEYKQFLDAKSDCIKAKGPAE